MKNTNRWKYFYLFWVFFIIGIILGGLIFKKDAHGKSLVKAPIIINSKFYDPCYLNRMKPCHVHEFNLYNPNFKSLSVVFDCGKKIEPSIILLYPRVRQGIQISYNGEMLPCKISRWRLVK